MTSLSNSEQLRRARAKRKPENFARPSSVCRKAALARWKKWRRQKALEKLVSLPTPEFQPGAIKKFARRNGVHIP